MAIKSQKAEEILVYIKTHPDAKLGDWPIEIAGQVRKKPYYKLPIKLLRYSVENGRFAAEKLALEAELNRTLDPDDPSDITEIRKMLIGVDPEATQKLKTDLQERGQLAPGVITADGYIKNGNRRMAIFEELHKDHPQGKYQYLEVIVLPDSVSESDLWRIEAGLQLSQETKLNYGPINELLKLNEGRSAGLTEKEMAAVMYGWTEEKVREALERLILIESYLEFWKKPKKYKEAENTHEYFINLQNLIISWKREGIEILELNERIEAVFCYIGNVNLPEKKTSHTDIRKPMNDIFKSDKARKVFLESVSDKAHEKYQNKTTAELAFEGFTEAKELTQLEAERSQPKKLLSRVVQSLEVILDIAQSNKHFNNEENMWLLRRIIKLVEEISKRTGINGSNTSRH